VENRGFQYEITPIFFIVHRYSHSPHMARNPLRLICPVFHNASGGSGSGQLLNNSFTIKNRTTGTLFTVGSGRCLYFISILIPFTETTVGLGCFSTKKYGYTRAVVQKRSTGFCLFHGIFVVPSPFIVPDTWKCHLNQYPREFACFAQFVHNHFSAIFAILSKKPIIYICLSFRK